MRLFLILLLISNIYNGIAQDTITTYAQPSIDSVHKHHRIRFAIDGGPSCFTYRAESMKYERNKSYYRQSRDGQHFHFSFKYLYTAKSGIGLSYIFFSSSHESSDDVIMSDGKWLQFGKMSNEVKVNYIGLYWGFQHLFTSKHSLQINYSAGWINYYNNRWLWNHYTMKTNTFGLIFDIGYDYAINKSISIGFKTTYLWSNVTSYNKNDRISQYSVKLDKNDHELLSRLDFSIGLRYNYCK